MPTILLDENIDGYGEYLARFIFSPEWGEISSLLKVQLTTFEQESLARGTPDDVVWEFCQERRYYLITDNRNDDKPDSLEATIRTRGQADSYPVFTISDANRFRSERAYMESSVVKLLEYLVGADNLCGAGRLYLP